ncbi:4'-phosphopantetheinyl transferase family protein [Gelidibacter maritimus]|uniref:4'-phosphopantetheinyl transferase superfamily protein n=1 Tax=Gelidibacter maritimus TaxID=2761487 RepID=A0A7W2M270_9FLAO|nr:4'-phosphopantetheinyl transferase superfamily protein [Gelidibacter maritimus]MBA6151369.1 4'-phosphopantetheinyl transferase superfamily protein [Gelidibacter maritimus]
MYSTINCKTIESVIPDSNHTMEADHGIKLYKIELSKLQDLVPDLMGLLSHSECNRANRYHFTKDKNRFVICRALLKFLLAKHIVVDIGEINLKVDINKKPYLPSHPSVFFNVSHAEAYALIAIGKSQIGIDIEFINRGFNYDDILKHVFNQKEINTITVHSDKHLSFYKFWTRKEAVVKAVGKGIDDNISKIHVLDGLHSLPSSLFSNYKVITILSFQLNPDYIGALSVTEDLSNLEKITLLPAPTREQLKLLF